RSSCRPPGRAGAPGQLRGPGRGAKAGPAPAGALRRPAGQPSRMARPCRAAGRAAVSSLAGPAARRDPRTHPRVRACDAAALRRLVVIVPSAGSGFPGAALDELEAEPALDAQVAVRDLMVEG